jgi:hypothetical protein
VDALDDYDIDMKVVQHGDSPNDNFINGFPEQLWGRISNKAKVSTNGMVADMDPDNAVVICHSEPGAWNAPEAKYVFNYPYDRKGFTAKAVVACSCSPKGKIFTTSGSCLRSPRGYAFPWCWHCVLALRVGIACWHCVLALRVGIECWRGGALIRLKYAWSTWHGKPTSRYHTATCPPSEEPLYTIGRTMFETDNIPADWVKRCNFMCVIRVASLWHD